VELRHAGVVGRARLGVKHAEPQSALPIASPCDSSLCGYGTDSLGTMAILMTCGGVNGYLAIVPGQSQLQELCMTMYLVPAIHTCWRMTGSRELGTCYTLRSIGAPTRLPHSVQEPS
jgi:hypothetical protein